MSKKHTLWIELFRAQTLDQYIGSEDLKSRIADCIEKNDIPHFIFSGTAGTGKTTLAKLIVNNIKCDYLYINASDENGIDTIRERVKGFASTASFSPIKVVVMDECLDENTLVTVLRKGNIVQIPIKDLDETEDLVKSLNIETNSVEWKPFYLLDKGIQETIEIEFENGEKVICTPDHKWYIKDEKGEIIVIKASQLEEYMEIYNPTV
jgi:replication factor C small subunit